MQKQKKNNKNFSGIEISNVNKNCLKYYQNLNQKKEICRYILMHLDWVYTKMEFLKWKFGSLLFWFFHKKNIHGTFFHLKVWHKWASFKHLKKTHVYFNGGRPALCFTVLLLALDKKNSSKNHNESL